MAGERQRARVKLASKSRGNIALSRCLTVGLFCLLSVFVLLPDAAAQTQIQHRPFSAVVEQWEREFNAITLEIDRGEISTERAAALKATLAEIGTQAEEAQNAAETALAPFKIQLESLGPVPAEDAPPETDEITAQRQKIGEDIADYEARIKQAHLAATKVKELGVQINAMTLENSIQRLIQEYPIPVAPGTIAEAVPEFFKLLAVMSQAPVEWWQSLDEDQQHKVLTRIALYLVPAIIVAWLLRIALLRFFGRDAKTRHPTYARRLTGAVAEGSAYGIVPSFILVAILLRAQNQATLMSGLLAEMVVAGCAVAILITLAWALSRAVFAPDVPDWRVLPVSAAHAGTISRRIVYLAAIFGIDLFFFQVTANLDASAALVSLFALVTKTLEAASVMALLPSSLWTWEEEQSEGEQPQAEGATAKKPRSRLWTALRFLSLLAAVAAAASALLGYANISRYLMNSLVVSGMAVGALYLVRGALRELIGVALRSRVMVLSPEKVMYSIQSDISRGVPLPTLAAM